MKIAITAKGGNPEAEVDPRFGRASQFVIMDTETGAYEAVDNAQNLNAPQGAGIQAARTVADKSVGALITGHCGPNAFKTLNAAGIKIYAGAAGTVAEMFEKYKNGELKTADGADVEGHW